MVNNNLITLPESFSETRRLAVVRKIVDLISEGFIHERILVNKLERWCEDNRETLHKSHIEPSGLVGSSLKHKSSINYLKVVQGAGLIKNLYGSRWIPTKYGDVLSKLPKNQTSLQLKLHEICFFIRQLLARDLTYMRNLVEAIRVSKDSSEIPKNFKQRIVTQLSTQQEVMVSISEWQELRKRLDKAKRWEKIRLNHIVIPRINWMIDLRVIDWGLYKEGVIAIGDEGMTIFSNASKIAKGNLNEWLQGDFYAVFSRGYRNLLPSKLKLWQDLEDTHKKETAAKCIENGFQILGGREVRRVSIVPLLEYFCIHLLITDGIICSINELHGEIEKIARSRNDLTYRWVPYDRDGYIRQIS